MKHGHRSRRENPVLGQQPLYGFDVMFIVELGPSDFAPIDPELTQQGSVLVDWVGPEIVPSRSSGEEPGEPVGVSKVLATDQPADEVEHRAAASQCHHKVVVAAEVANKTDRLDQPPNPHTSLGGSSSGVDKAYDEPVVKSCPLDGGCRPLRHQQNYLRVRVSSTQCLKTKSGAKSVGGVAVVKDHEYPARRSITRPALPTQRAGHLGHEGGHRDDRSS